MKVDTHKPIRFWLTLSLLILLSSLNALLYFERETQNAYKSQQESLNLSDALRQSSDDLTRLVRAYVVTKNTKYKSYFYEVLSIRDGVTPRPVNINAVYWDLVGVDDVRPIPFTAPKALLALMKEAGFSEAEFELLEEAKVASDALTKIEFSAMEMVQDDNLTPSQHLMAVNTLFDENYHQHKAEIMGLIGQFQAMVESRGRVNIQGLEDTAFKALLVAFISAIASAYLLFRLVLIRKKESIELTHLVAQSAEHLEKLSNQAIEASNAKSRFLSKMSHEMRTPLNVITGLTEEILRNSNNEQNIKNLLRIKNSANQMAVLVGDVLDFSKIGSDDISLVNEAFDLKVLIGRVIEVSRSKALDKGLNLQSEIRFNPTNLLIGDDLRIEQILTNLILNAIKFTDHGEVTLIVELKQQSFKSQTLLFKVRDTGRGIPDSEMTRLFSAFEQQDDSYIRMNEGTGLGLAICHNLVSLMGGQIYVDSKIGEGSEFFVNLELTKGRARDDLDDIAGHELELQQIELSVREKMKLKSCLLVEDNDVNIMVMLNHLNRFRVIPDVAKSGLQAVEMNKVNIYNLIFMDVHMPELDGISATEQIRVSNEEGVIIGVSAEADVSEIHRARAAGMDDYLIKPLAHEKLAKVLDKHLK